jgi:hypothetical protein
MKTIVGKQTFGLGWIDRGLRAWCLVLGGGTTLGAWVLVVGGHVGGLVVDLPLLWLGGYGSQKKVARSWFGALALTVLTRVCVFVCLCVCANRVLSCGGAWLV